MRRILALLGLSLLFLLPASTSAQARHCYDRCNDRCRPVDCCREKVCYPIYRWVTKKVFDGYRYDCNDCRHPVYRTVRVKVYAGKRCDWRDSGYRQRSNDRYSEDDDDAYRPPQRSYSNTPDYTGANHAFPNYEGPN